MTFDIRKLFCGMALAGAGLLCVIDFLTSYMGIDSLIPNRSSSFILQICPFVFASLALSINALSSWLFRMTRDMNMTDFTNNLLTFCFLGFLLYDGVSSFLGMLSLFSEQTITSVGSLKNAYNSIELAQVILSAVIATLASFSPLLVSVFWMLWKDLDTNVTYESA